MYISKIVFLTFIIFFSTLSFGADFRDLNLKIGGINLGDDLSQHLSSYQIEQGKKGTENWYNHLKEPNKFPTVIITNHPVINKKYRRVSFNVMEIEEKFIIHMIRFGELYKNKSGCKKDMKLMTEKMSKKFPNLEKKSDERKHSADPSGDSIETYESFTDSKNNKVAVICTDWSEKITRTKNWTDNLSFVVQSKDFNDWLDEKK